MKIEVIVLVGGSGSRLWPLTQDRPKPLLPILGKPMLDQVLEPLNLPLVSGITLAVGYRAEAFDHYRSFRPLRVVVEESPRGTGGALSGLRSQLTAPVLVLNGDTLLQIDLLDFWAQHQASGALLSMAVTEVEEAGRYGRVEFDAEGRVVSFREKDPAFLGRAWINAGAYLFSPQAWANLPDQDVYSLEQEVFPSWIGRSFYTWMCSGPFLDVGTPEAYLEAHFRAGLVISSEARISPGAVVDGPAYVGPGCVVSAGCRLERCVLEQDVLVESDCRLSNCILSRGCRVAANSTLVRQVWAGEHRRGF